MKPWYIVASRQHGAYVLPLVGPWRSAREAGAMLRTVTNAVRKHRADLAGCDVLVLTLHGEPQPMLPLHLLNPDDVLEAHRSLMGSLKRS